LTLSSAAQATNGDMLFGVAPAARAMGGTGVAAPQDAISAIFANPAAVCMGPYCPGSQTVFAATLYTPTTKAAVTVNGVETAAESDMKPFIIPAIGVIIPYNDRLRFGFGMFGIAGMGVDYRNAGLPDLNPQTPANEGDIYTQIQVMKFAPNVAYLVTPDFSIGASLHLLYGSLDLGQGMSHNYAVGGQVGAIYKIDSVSLGLSYTTPEETSHQKVSDFGNPDLVRRSLSLESPHNIAVGVAWRPTNKLLVEADLKWLNWANASGYKDFDWENQWVYAVGVQYKDPDGLILRGGYNYGKNPVKMHDGFNPGGTTMVQGKALNTTSYEYMRIIGFPAAAEHHFTVGVGYRFDSSFEAHIGAMYALNKKISESGGPFKFSAELQETSYDVGLVWSFF
jgi:long-chain fatty acid transport protein